MDAKPKLNLLWLQAGGCGGCSMSLLNAQSPQLIDALEAVGIRLLWHPSLSEASGGDAATIIESCAEGTLPLDVLCIEGAMMRGPRGSGRFQRCAVSEEPMITLVQRLAAQARWTVAVGSCAAYGGVVAASGNPAEACGLQFEDDEPGGLLGTDYRSGAGLAVINVAGCPPHPNWMLDTFLTLTLGETAARDFDAFGRPRLFADHLVHHGCTRNEFYEFKASAEHPSDLGCLMENMGCMGTLAHADCNVRLWNGEGSCTRGGFACIACTEPGFQEPGHPFAKTPKIAGIPVGLPTDMPKAWFVALAALSKSATPRRVRENARSYRRVVAPALKRPIRK
jgi:ferredoxin hydrogenase small subunit